mgnify:CR=1 FL=1
MNDIVCAYITDIELWIYDLCALQQELTQLLAQCQHGKVAECRLIGALQPYADRPTAG